MVWGLQVGVLGPTEPTLNSLGPEWESLILMSGTPEASVLFPMGLGVESEELSPEPGALTLPGSQAGLRACGPSPS